LPSDLDQRKAQAEADEANVSAAQSNVAAQGANVGRLEQLKAFTRVLAPFAGTITVRSVERGALVSGQSPLFRLAATDPVRVFVQVPQGVAPSVRTQQPALVNVREYPTRPFTGTVVRAAGALDPTMRTMNTEVRVPNPTGELIPGMYAQVTLTLPTPFLVYEIPATALYNDAGGAGRGGGRVGEGRLPPGDHLARHRRDDRDRPRAGRGRAGGEARQHLAGGGDGGRRRRAAAAETGREEVKPIREGPGASLPAARRASPVWGRR